MSRVPKPRRAFPPWQPGHFIGGHVALDLTNTVFQRIGPIAENELFKTPADVGAWCRSVGLASASQAARLSAHGDQTFVKGVRGVRERAWAVFSAISAGRAPPSQAVGKLLRIAGRGASLDLLSLDTDQRGSIAGDLGDPDAIPPALSLLAIEAMFTLPKDRIRACPRCGWLFLDRSKAGLRRWCDMTTCGNREKAQRHRRG